MLALCGCKKNVPDEAEYNEKANALLQVQTRAGETGEDATVSYPVNVYVFQEEQCKALQTISDTEQTLSISLEEGLYTVYAIGGASETDYVIPSKDNATPSSIIALQDGKTLTDLMAAMSTVTLVEGETNTLTLSMERKVMLLQSVVISNLPTYATAVSVSIAPLWQNLTIETEFTGTQGTARIALAKQDDGRTWKSTSEEYLFPPSTTTATISVSLTTAEGTKSYSYNSSGKLEAGYKINIEGTYIESVGVTLTGTITGEAWKGERTVSFDFDEEGSSEGNGDNNGNNPSSFPAVGDIYEGCYVLAVNTLNATSAELTLLSPTEHVPIYDSNEKTMNSLISSALATYSTHAVSGWHVPTADEMAILATGYAGVEAAGQKPLGSTNKNYLFIRSSDNAYRSHTMGRTFTEEGNNPNAQTYLRPMATVTITSD
jgi:hypothetical protein